MIRLLLILLLLGSSARAHAHAASEATLSLRLDGDVATLRLDLPLRDLDRELALDANGDGALSWGEVRSRWADIEHLADTGLRFTADGAACQPLERQPAQLSDHSDGRHAVLIQRWRCPGAVGEISVDYRLFAATDAGHRVLARIEGRPGAPTVLVPGAGPQPLQPGPHSLLGFMAEGLHHIASGADHLLFLATLLLVAVWRREGRGWAPRETARSAVGEALKLVTAFTVAHSLTLGLAASGLIQPSARWVESLIALTVLIAALDNLRPRIPGPRWAVVGAFGLVHGIGFAGPLADLGLRGTELLLPLLGFNLGVELGQLAVVALLLPPALMLRARPVYRRWIVPVGSGTVAVLALLWCIERVTEVNLLP